MATIIARAPLPQQQVQAAPQIRVQDQGYDPTAQNRAVEAVADLGQGILKAEQAKNDTAAVLQARRELSDWEASTFNPGNADGIAKYRGKNALGAGELVPQLDERTAEINKRLTPSQQQAFAGVSASFRDSLQGRLNSHMDREHSAYIAGEQKAAIDNVGNDAVAAGVAGDWGRQDQLANEVLGMNRARWESEGAGEEQIKASERAIVSTVRKGTIDGLMTNRPFEAQAYYQRYADQMTPEDRAATERLLQPIVMDAETTATADAIWAGQRPTEGPEDVDAQINQLEGTGQNPRSSARGVGQFIDSTWLETIKKHRPDLTEGKSNAEILTLKDDPKIATELLTKFRQDNARSLTARGITPNAENLYAAHHFGVGGATKFAKASNNTPMSEIVSRRELQANPYLRGKTVGDVKQNWAERGLRVAGVSEPMAGPPPTTTAEAVQIANDTIRDPRYRAQVISKIRTEGAVREEQKREQERLLSEQAYTAISRNTDPRKPLREILGADAFALAERTGRLDTLESYRKNVLTGTLTQSNPVLVDALHREAVLSPNTFRKRNLYQSVGELSTDDLADLTRMQSDLSKPDKAAEWATTNERIDAGYRVLGLDPTQDEKKNKDVRQEQRAAFSVAYRNAEKAFVQKYKKQPTPAEADVLLRNVTKAAAQALSEEKLTLKRYGSIEGYGTALSSTTRAEIVADFTEARGREPTEAEIVNIAALAKQRGL